MQRAALTVRARPAGASTSSALHGPLRCRGRFAGHVAVRAHKVELSFEGETTVLEVGDGETILEVAKESGLDLPCDCMMGVCMACPAKLVDGHIDQGAGMLSEDTIEKGYALLCVATPTTDCKIDCIDEEELLSVQMGAI